VDDAYAAWVLQPTLPLAVPEPRLAWFLCGVQRSGTWLLAGLLDSTGVAGRPHEWFSEATEAANRRAWRVHSTEEYMDCVRRAGTTPNGVFACKLSWNTVSRAGNLDAFAPDRRFVWLRRDPGGNRRFLGSRRSERLLPRVGPAAARRTSVRS